MAAISDNLIHFLARNQKECPNKQLNVFKLILQNGLRCGKVFIKFAEGASVTNQIICFTDIPIRDCNEHTSIYGKFGIGFKKSYVKNAGGNPARYFLDYMPGQLGVDGKSESRGVMYHNLCEQFKILKNLSDRIAADPTFTLHEPNGNVFLNAKVLKGIIDSQIYLFSFDKEMGDLGPARDETREIDLYYKEREWRLVPSKIDVASGVVEVENSTNYIFYKFQCNDVNMIVVPNEEIRISVLEYLLELRNASDDRLKGFGLNPLPVINYDDLQRW